MRREEVGGILDGLREGKLREIGPKVERLSEA
jgi:hypothetical protein